MNRQSTKWLLVITLSLVLVTGILLAVPSTRDSLMRFVRGESAVAGEHRHQGKTLNEWVQQLKSDVVKEQHSACYAIQYFRSEDAVAAVPALVPLLTSKESQLRSGAAYALGRIGRPAQEALLPLAELLTDRDPHVRANAAESFDFMSDARAKAAVPALSSALEKAVKEKPTDETDRNFRLYIARSLGKIGAEAKPAVPHLTALLSEKDAYLRSAAGEALGQIGPDAKPAVPALTAALEDSESAAKLEAALALWRIERSEKAVPVLLGVFKDDKNPYVRVTAAGALGKIGAPAKAAVLVLQDAAKNDPTRGVKGRYEVRTAAEAALKLIGE